MMFTSFGATNGCHPPFEYELGCLQLVIKISVESQNWIRQFPENLFGNAKLFFLSKWDVGKFPYHSFNCPVSSFSSGNDKIISQ